VVPIPAHDRASALGSALSAKGSVGGAARTQAESPAAALAEAVAEAQAPPAPPAPITPSRNGASGTHASTTTVDRMLARTSPYETLRLLSVIIFVLGVVASVLVLLGGLAALVFISIYYGQPWVGVGAFVAALGGGAILFILGKALSELVRLWADVGDRSRQMVMLLEEMLTQKNATPL
jgi:hypothetical protein